MSYFTRILFTGPPLNGKLTISTENPVLIKVQDTGIGIAREDLPHIFDPFYSKGKHKGTGLGLAIVHRIIKEHGGAIKVESCPEEGTAFCISLPSYPENICA